MWGQKKTGSVICRSCGRLVGVADERCFHCGARRPSLWGLAPALRKLPFDVGLTEVIATACIVLYLATLLVDPQGIRNQGLLSFLSPSVESLLRFGASGALPVVEFGRGWTLLSAGWLHGSALHIFFNVMWIRSLAPAVIEIYGGSRATILYVVSSVAGFALSTFAPLFLPWGGGVSVGASAAIFGLLGALVHYGRKYGSARMARDMWGWAAFLFAWGFIASGVDNWAHLGGFAGGWVASYFLNPMKPERMNHTILAALCLLASAAAVLASLLVPLPIPLR